MKFWFTLLFTCFSFTLSAQFQNGSKSLKAQGFYQKALTFEKQANFPEAKNLLFQALDEDPSFTSAMNSLAEVYRNLDMVDSTIHYYESSLSLQPKGLYAHQNLAAAFQMKGQFDKAIDQYKKLLDHFPNYPQAYYGMALINYNQRRFPQSIQGSEKAIRLFLTSKSSINASDARMLAGQAYMKMGDYQTAVKYFKASRKHFESKPFYHYYVGFCYLRSGKKDKASQSLTQAEFMGYKIPQYIKEELETL